MSESQRTQSTPVVVNVRRPTGEPTRRRSRWSSIPKGISSSGTVASLVQRLRSEGKEPSRGSGPRTAIRSARRPEPVDPAPFAPPLAPCALSMVSLPSDCLLLSRRWLFCDSSSCPNRDRRGVMQPVQPRPRRRHRLVPRVPGIKVPKPPVAPLAEQLVPSDLYLMQGGALIFPRGMFLCCAHRFSRDWFVRAAQRVATAHSRTVRGVRGNH